MRQAIKYIDWVNEQSGVVFKWSIAALIIVVFTDTVARYAFNSPLTWGYDMSCMLGFTANAMFWGYVRKHHSHVRVDIIYNHFSVKTQRIFEVVLAVVLLFPLLVIFLRITFLFMVRAMTKGDILVTSYWYPPAWPMRTIVVVALILLFLQCIVETIRDIEFLRTGEQL